MILTGNEIKKNVKLGNIQIESFDSAMVGTNSYDLCLDDTLLIYKEEVLDIHKNNKVEEIKIPKRGILLPANSFVLGSSTCKIGSDIFVPIIHGKSTTARAGLFVHITADLIDIGFYGNTTFQLYNILPIMLYPGMKIAQVSFWKTQGLIKLYDGKYQGANGPLASKIFKDEKR